MKEGLESEYKIAVFAGGCFWCTEAVFNRIIGVKEVIPGYTGGFIKNPAYREICTGRTGHAEGIKIVYDPKQINFQELLEIFFTTHDPTTPNQQGNDRGTQYRSAIFYMDEQQKKIVKHFIKELDEQRVFENSIVTELKPFEAFYNAEEEHREFYEHHKTQPYCEIIINPKLQKLKQHFSDKLKQYKTI